jgi:hypothetical protein
VHEIDKVSRTAQSLARLIAVPLLASAALGAIDTAAGCSKPIDAEKVRTMMRMCSGEDGWRQLVEKKGLIHKKKHEPHPTSSSGSLENPPRNPDRALGSQSDSISSGKTHTLSHKSHP